MNAQSPTPSPWHKARVQDLRRQWADYADGTRPVPDEFPVLLNAELHKDSTPQEALALAMGLLAEAGKSDEPDFLVPYYQTYCICHMAQHKGHYRSDLQAFMQGQLRKTEPSALPAPSLPPLPATANLEHLVVSLLDNCQREPSLEPTTLAALEPKAGAITRLIHKRPHDLARLLVLALNHQAPQLAHHATRSLLAASLDTPAPLIALYTEHAQASAYCGTMLTTTIDQHLPALIKAALRGPSFSLDRLLTQAAGTPLGNTLQRLSPDLDAQILLRNARQSQDIVTYGALSAYIKYGHGIALSTANLDPAALDAPDAALRQSRLRQVQTLALACRNPKTGFNVLAQLHRRLASEPDLCRLSRDALLANWAIYGNNLNAADRNSLRADDTILDQRLSECELQQTGNTSTGRRKLISSLAQAWQRLLQRHKIKSTATIHSPPKNN